MANNALIWIEAGRRFGFDDLVHWRDRGREPFEAAAVRIDTIVLGPHASAAFPEELRPFVAPGLTRRKQCDFSDIATFGLGRAWADADPHVVFVHNPVSRLVLDPNRARPADPIGSLREFYARLRRQRKGEQVVFAGVDAVRPVTFSGEDVLLEPTSSEGWASLADALGSVIGRAVDRYRATCDQVVDTVLAHRPPRAALRVISLHDTMNTQMRRDGALVVERPAADRLPTWVNFGNRGDARGEAEGDTPLTINGPELRRLATAWADALGLDQAGRRAGIWLNRPYKGAFETVHYGARLRSLGHPRVGAVQVEFLRESLLGSAATSRLHAPGDDWPHVDEDHCRRLAAALAAAGRTLRG